MLVCLLIVSSRWRVALAETIVNTQPQITGDLSYTRSGDNTVSINGIDIVDDSDVITVLLSLQSGVGAVPVRDKRFTLKRLLFLNIAKSPALCKQVIFL